MTKVLILTCTFLAISLKLGGQVDLKLSINNVTVNKEYLFQIGLVERNTVVDTNWLMTSQSNLFKDYFSVDFGLNDSIKLESMDIVILYKVIWIGENYNIKYHSIPLLKDFIDVRRIEIEIYDPCIMNEIQSLENLSDEGKVDYLILIKTYGPKGLFVYYKYKYV